MCLATTTLAQENAPPAPVESPGFVPRTGAYPRFYSDEPRSYNLKWGPVTGRLRGSFQAELNDNINLSDAHREEDLVFGPFVGIGFLWPVSERNLLQFDLGLGYRAYAAHPELNSLLISPDSRLNYQVRVLNAEITIHDTFSVEVDPLSRPELSGDGSEVLDYRRFNNEAGATVNWSPFRDVTLIGGYNFVIDRSLNDDFIDLDRDDHVFHLAAYHPAGSRLNLGIGSSYTITRYVRPIQNDGEIFSVGPHLIARISDFITADAGAGYTIADYHQTGTISDASDFAGLTFFGGLRHRMNSRTTHYVRVTKNVNPGYGSNFTDIFSTQYGISLRAAAAVTFNGTFVFEDLTSSSNLGEDSQRYLWYLSSNLRLSSRWQLALAYSFALKNSALAERDYRQNRLTLELTREF